MPFVYAVVSVADQYMIMMAIALLFTVLALALHEKLLLSGLAGLTWFMVSFMHMAVGDTTSILTPNLGWLFFGLGIVFTVYTIYESMMLWTTDKTSNRFSL